MKLLLKFSGFGLYEKSELVTWYKPLDEFPKFCKYDNRFWGWVFYDKDHNGIADQVLTLSEHKESAVPIDIFGVPFPVTDLELMFNLKSSSALKCECGTDTYGCGKHSDYCPKYEKT